jgi:TPR repeat protein
MYGFTLQFGLGVGQDGSLAAKYYELAARHNDSNGMNHFGLCLGFGNGVAKDIYRASQSISGR